MTLPPAPPYCPSVACEAACAGRCTCEPCSCPRHRAIAARAAQARADTARHLEAAGDRLFRYLGTVVDSRLELVLGPPDDELPLRRPHAPAPPSTLFDPDTGGPA